MLSNDYMLSPYVFLQTVARPGFPETEIRKVTERVTEQVSDDLRAEMLALRQANQTLRYWLITITGVMGLLTAGACASLYFSL